MQRSRVLLFVFAVLFSATSFAQVSRIAGQLTGTVRDAAGAYVADAEVAAINTDTNQRWSTITDSGGHFRLSNLPDGTYVVHVQKQGFAELTSNPVWITVGNVAAVSLELQLPSARQQLTVNAEPSILDPEQTSRSNLIDKERIEESPVQSRNYQNFILLAPGITPANRPGGNSSVSAPASGFSIGGLRPRSNAIYLDGSSNNDEFTGGNRTEISLEDVQEFQVVNHGFAAESGGAAGGSIDVVTRAGANTIHGDAFIFVQNGAFDAKPPLESNPTRPDINRERIGFSIGGPIRKNRTFYYTSFEQEHSRGEESSEFSPETITAAAGLPGSRQLTTGFFPTGREETEFATRFDQQIGTKNSLMLRYSFNNNREVNDAFNTSDLVDFTGRGSVFTEDHQLVAGLTTSVSSQSANEVHFAVSTRRDTQRTVDQAGPAIEVPGFLQFGRPYAGNGTRHENHVEGSESYSWQRGSHLFKAGAWIDHVAERSALGDGFGGVLSFPALQALSLRQPDFYDQAFGDVNVNYSETRYAAFVQDHWAATHRLTLDYGVRYDFNQLPSPISQRAWNISPRVGVAFQPANDWVIRAGFGLLYDRYPLAAIHPIVQKNGARAFDQVLSGPAAVALYTTGIPTSPVLSAVPSIVTAQPDLANPYSQVATLGVERSLSTNLSLGATYSFVRGTHLLRTLDVNLAPPQLLTAANAASLGIANPAPQQIGRYVFPSRLDPAFDRVDQLQSSAASTYNGVTVTVNRRLHEEFELLASYTYSKTIDTASDFWEQPQNPYNLAQERAVSLQDQRHTFVASALWDLPIGDEDEDQPSSRKAAKHNWIIEAFSDIEVAPILSVGSGQPINPLVGNDANLSHAYPFFSRPLGFGRNSLRMPASMVLDFRILKSLMIGRGKFDIVAESFNVLNHTNVTDLNPFFGPGSVPNQGFGRPINTQTSRQVQFSLDYEF